MIVTHQKRTMDAADVLYGVSMGGDGVTKVVSRRLPREDEAAEEAGEAPRAVRRASPPATGDRRSAAGARRAAPSSAAGRLRAAPSKPPRPKLSLTRAA